VINKINDTSLENFANSDIKEQIFNRLFPIDQKEGFYMNQKIGNCYLIASLNSMRLNKNFMQDLYKNIEFVLWKTIYDSKVIYKFSDWEKITVVLKDLKIQKEQVNIQELNNIVEIFNKWQRLPIDNYSFTQTELNNALEKIDTTEEILKNIENNKQKVSDLLWMEKLEFFEDSRWRKKMLFKKEFVWEIEEQIKNKNWEYYDLLKKEKTYNSVNAPLWYKILEALYTKKVFWLNMRKNTISWKSIDVFNLFLDDKKWGKKTLQLNFNKEQIIDILYSFNSHSNDFIITASIYKRNPLNTTAYFYYKNKKMAEWHAYSIVWFNKEKWEIEVVNPWNNNEILSFSIDDFFKLFSDIVLAKKD